MEYNFVVEFFVEATMIPRLIFLFIASTSLAAAVPHSGTRLATVSIVESDKNAGYVVLKSCVDFV